MEHELTTEEWKAQKKEKKAAMAQKQAIPYRGKVSLASTLALLTVTDVIESVISELDGTSLVGFKNAPTIEPERAGNPDRIYTELSKVYNMKGLPDDVYSIIGDLMISLPDEPERKKGKWIDCDGSEHWKCDKCGCRAGYWFNEENSSSWELDMSEWLSNFCPNCGAEMTEEKE